MSGILTLSTTQIIAGNSITVSGTGFGRSVAVKIYLDSTGHLADATTNTNGSFSTSVKIPTTVGAGYHNLTVTSTNTASQTISVTGSSPSPSPSGMIAALDVGKWGVGIAGEIKSIVGHVRLDTPDAATINSWVSAGVNVIADIVGPYNSGGVAALDANAWATNAVNLYNSAPKTVAIEILNEPAGSWFWGSNAANSTNAAAYARLLKTVNAAFVANGSKPKLIASYDGGYAGSSAWGQAVTAADPNVWSYVDGIVIHAYGGTSDRTASALGSRTNLTNAHNATGKPVWVTEVGWPTATSQASTGDSFQWSETDQATNIYNFITWARSTGYVSNVTIFNYRDYGTNAWYGVTRSDGSHKKSFTDLGLAAQGLPQS